jgi:MoxR-like ATPase
MQSVINNVLNQIESVVLGKPHECRLALSCLLAEGHLLIEDLPGMGKTTLAHALANTLGLSYQRTQFTSDLLPADIIGISIFNKDINNFELHKGPVFNQVVLADEINRASPKTQSALLEAMAEKQVSIDGKTYNLPVPFFVIATQNPLYHAGTYPLPESQLDRFMMRISLGFPNAEAEKRILLSDGNTLTKTQGDASLLTAEKLTLMQKAIKEVHVSDQVVNYIIALCHVTRGQQISNMDISCNPLSPRAAKALIATSKSWAYIHERDYVTPDDVQAVFESVALHRIELMQTDKVHQSNLCETIINCVDVLNPQVN